MGFVNRGLKIDFSRDHIFYYAKVVSVEDTSMGGRIKARIIPDDKDYEFDSDLPYCYPLIPKFFNVVPKVGEAVRILMYTTNKYKTDINRAYIGPVIGQPQNLLKDTKLNSMVVGSDVGYGEPEEAPEFGAAVGIYPNVQDVAIQGRDNSDIILNKREVNLRAGKFKDNNPLVLNNVQQPRIQLKSVNDETSSASIIATKINLVSYEGKTGISFDKLDGKGLNHGIKSGVPSNLLETYLDTVTEPLIYGNLLVDFLTLIKDYITNHEHKDGEGKPISGTGSLKKIQSYNLENLKSENIRIN
tara:strand:+ start:1200 stop:2102 length:903 start_codon:yes stop_codon:yes gene_type:complete